MNIIPEIIEFIRENGPTSSLDLPHQEKVDWWWGRQKASRAALEVLYHTYRIQIHHRVRSRRYFDLTENLVPPEIISQPDPFKTIEEYHDAHFLRRISGLGLVRAKASDLWGGILNAKTPERRASFKRLLDAKKILKVQIAGIDNISFYINAELANELSSDISGTPRAVFVPPLDNFMWDRDLLKILFNFDYIWEIYKPATKRKYGYYVLPVIYGQRIIARLDAKAERKQGILMMNNWWFEEDVRPSKAMVQSIRISIRRLARLLELNEIQYSSSFKEKFSDSFSSLLS